MLNCQRWNISNKKVIVWVLKTRYNFNCWSPIKII